jgi:hypothetical protein
MRVRRDMFESSARAPRGRHRNFDVRRTSCALVTYVDRGRRARGRLVTAGAIVIEDDLKPLFATPTELTMLRVLLRVLPVLEHARDSERPVVGCF